MTGIGRDAHPPRLRGHRLHDLPGLRPSATASTRSCARSPTRPSDAGLPIGGLELPARRRPLQGGRDAIDVTAYAAQIAAQLGAHIIKVKPPTAHLEQADAKKVYEKDKIPHRDAGRARPARRPERVQRQAHRHLLGRRGQGHRPQPCSTRSARIPAGGGFGSIMGRNAFQRPHDEAIAAAQRCDEHLRRQVAEACASPR